MPETGTALSLSPHTVRFHLTKLLRKTGFSTRKALVEAFDAELREGSERDL